MEILKAAIAAGKKVGANNGAMKGGLLPVQVTAAEEKFGHMTDAELDDYKMSHGHCVQSSY